MPLCVEYYGSTSTVSYYTSFTVNAVNTWQYITITISPPPSSAGVFSMASLNNKIAAIKFMHTTSTNVNGTVTNNTWSTTQNANNSIALNLGSSSWTRYLTGLQLEKGTIATPFEFRPYAIELQLCQRYYVRIFNTTTYDSIGYCMNETTAAFTTAQARVDLPVQMRAAPVYVQYSGTISANGATVSAIANHAAFTTLAKGSLTITIPSTSFTAWIYYSLRFSNASTAYIDFTAEL
jgi:hypothetical protein